MSELVLQAKDVNYKAGNKIILNNINWQIKKGEQWVVFGLNASGKTSLLSVISAYKGVMSGEMILFGCNLDESNRLQQRCKIGFVSSSFFDHYFKYETVLEIVLSGKFGHLGLEYSVTSEDVRKAKQLLREWGLGTKIQYPYDMLSQGQKQKVLIARGLINDPELLILDEPCSGMDVLAREKFLDLLKCKIKKENISVVYVSHNVEEFSDVFNKALLLKNGHVHSQGDIKDIFTDENMSDFLQRLTKVHWLDERISMRMIKDEEEI